MGNVLSTVEDVVKSGFEFIKAKFQDVINFFIMLPGSIYDFVFSDPRAEFANEQEQEALREFIDEQRRMIEKFRRLMTCKCCNIGLIAYVFDCGHMACETCNESNCAARCFKCNGTIRQRGPMEYNRAMLD